MKSISWCLEFIIACIVPSDTGDSASDSVAVSIDYLDSANYEANTQVFVAPGFGALMQGILVRYILLLWIIVFSFFFRAIRIKNKKKWTPWISCNYNFHRITIVWKWWVYFCKDLEFGGTKVRIASCSLWHHSKAIMKVLLSVFSTWAIVYILSSIGSHISLC